jgi:hypothetical protein
MALFRMSLGSERVSKEQGTKQPKNEEIALL